jgi:hypothetical protein
MHVAGGKRFLIALVGAIVRFRHCSFVSGQQREGASRHEHTALLHPTANARPATQHPPRSNILQFTRKGFRALARREAHPARSSRAAHAEEGGEPQAARSVQRKKR